MNELVIMKSKQALTTSLKVAETFSKEHKVVMRAIKNLAAQNCTVEKCLLKVLMLILVVTSNQCTT